MEHATDTGVVRRSQLDERLAAVRTRLRELHEQRQGPAGPVPAAPSEWRQRVEAAQRHAATAQAAAVDQLTYCAASFRRAAQAHDRAAAEHERAANSGSSRSQEHARHAAIHKAAAIHDLQRADHVQSLLSAADPARASQSAA